MCPVSRAFIHGLDLLGAMGLDLAVHRGRVGAAQINLVMGVGEGRQCRVSGQPRPHVACRVKGMGLDTDLAMQGLGIQQWGRGVNTN